MMLRRILGRAVFASAFVMATASIVPAETREDASGICFTGCLLGCSPQLIQETCSQLCDDATGGLCGEHPMCIGSSYLICDGRVS